jgi:GNAT superfamily N-acetyltransferase
VPRIVDADPGHWLQIWPFFRAIVRAGETYAYDTDMDEATARALWMVRPPGRTVVALAEGGDVAGSAIMGPNRGGNGAHVATASFMVDPARAGGGVGRALGEHVIARAREDGYRAMQFNAVVETNAVAVRLWESLGFEIIGTVPAAFDSKAHGYVGLHVMYQRL